MDTNPPAAAPAAPAAAPAAAWPKPPRRLAAGRAFAWWSEGWQIFTAAPLPWIGVTVVVVLIGFVLSWIPVVGALANAILGPIFAGGLILGCQALAQGRPLQLTHLFAAFQSDRLGPLAILGLAMMAVIVVIGLVFGALVVGTMATGMIGAHGSSGASMAMLAGMGLASLLVFVVGVIVFVLVGLAWFFAPALVTLNRAPPIDALKASFGAAMANFGAVLLFGVAFVALAIVASIPFGLGWLVLLPVFVGGEYAAWREVFGE